jgi:hypothetical protein
MDGAGESAKKNAGPIFDAGSLVVPDSSSTSDTIIVPGFPPGPVRPAARSPIDVPCAKARYPQRSERRGFTYTVLSTDAGEVIGRVYICPPRGESQGGAGAGEQHAAVSSWMRASPDLTSSRRSRPRAAQAGVGCPVTPLPSKTAPPGTAPVAKAPSAR